MVGFERPISQNDCLNKRSYSTWPVADPDLRRDPLSKTYLCPFAVFGIFLDFGRGAGGGGGGRTPRAPLLDWLLMALLVN